MENKKMRLFVSVLIATMMALFMAIVVAYQAINYEYVTIYHLTMLSFFMAMFGFGVMWCLARFQDLQEEEKQPMARRVE
jgi:hypothetical protein